jgi:hypothetical protein
MANVLNVTMAFLSIVILESILLWIIYNLRAHGVVGTQEETHKQLLFVHRMKMWHNQHIKNLFQSITLYASLYSCLTLIFWGILLIFLTDEAAELIGLTWFIGPSFLLWGIIDGYSDSSGIFKSRGITDEKMRPVIIHLYNESNIGSLEAKNKLSELSHRNDEVGLLTREILHELIEQP